MRRLDDDPWPYLGIGVVGVAADEACVHLNDLALLCSTVMEAPQKQVARHGRARLYGRMGSGPLCAISARANSSMTVSPGRLTTGARETISHDGAGGRES